MSGLVNFLNGLFTYIKSLLFIDFTNYSGELPTEFITMYGYIETFFQIVCIFFFLYLVYNFIIFLVSLGSVRK